jgi:hypothetical protein
MVFIRRRHGRSPAVVRMIIAMCVLMVLLLAGVTIGTLSLLN